MAHGPMSGIAAVVVLLVLSAGAHAESGDTCPKVTVADAMGIVGAFPQQFELVEFEAQAACALTFSQNPDIAALNARITGSPDELPPVGERLPDEPLVVAPYERIGMYGGTLDGLSNATEAGTSDLLSVRHVNLVRFADDLTTIVPNVARAWAWNEDFTELTFTLRQGHKWSDGAPFTAEDVAFWYDHLTMDPNVVEKPRDLWMAGDEPFDVEVVDDVTVVFRLAAPKPGLLSAFATDYAQPFQPRHFLGPFHPAINPDADALAQDAGFGSGYDVLAFYYGGSDWKDVPSPLLKDPARIDALPAAVVPTLESHIVVSDTPEGRVAVANPYFFMVDTAGHQLPYINEISESYVPDHEARILRLIDGDVDYKAQSLTLADVPRLLEGQVSGGYTVEVRPQIGMPTFGFNVTSTDPEKRAVFSEKDFRLAMSYALNRPEINAVAYLGLGEPRQYLAFDPIPSFATAEQVGFATEFDAERAAGLLDGIGVVDRNDDGFRDLPSGERLTLNLRFSTAGLPAAVAELVAGYWSDIGIETVVEEVSSDAYRAAQSASQLDVIVWTKGRPIPAVQLNSDLFTPPFDDYFGGRAGMLWQRFNETGGAEGVEPPAWTNEMAEAVAAWQTHLPGTEESNALGSRLIDMTLERFMFIGTVSAPNPIYASNRLVNFETPRTWSYAYYRVYPYRPQQWALTE